MREEGFEKPPGRRNLMLWNKGDRPHHGVEFPNRRVWNKVFLHQVCLLEVLEETLLVVEETATASRRRPDLSNSIVDSQLVVQKDGLR